MEDKSGTDCCVFVPWLSELRWSCLWGPVWLLKMFAKLKKKIAEEAATSPRPGGVARMPRSVSKESITSVGADSGDDFVSAKCYILLSSFLKQLCVDLLNFMLKSTEYKSKPKNVMNLSLVWFGPLECRSTNSFCPGEEMGEVHQVVALIVWAESSTSLSHQIFNKAVCSPVSHLM